MIELTDKEPRPRGRLAVDRVQRLDERYGEGERMVCNPSDFFVGCLRQAGLLYWLRPCFFDVAAVRNRAARANASAASAEARSIAQRRLTLCLH